MPRTRGADPGAYPWPNQLTTLLCGPPASPQRRPPSHSAGVFVILSPRRVTPETAARARASAPGDARVGVREGVGGWGV